MTPSPFPALTAWRRRARAVAALVVVLPLVGLLTAAPASAHDKLVETSPAAGSTVTSSPAAITLRFNSPVQDISSLVRVTDAAGAVALESAGVIDGTVVTVAVPTTLANGTYTVTWRVVAGDGHPVQDAFVFTVAAPAPAPAPAPSATTATATAPATSATTPAATPSSTTSASSTASTATPTDGSDGSDAGGWASTPLRLVVGGLVLLAAAALSVIRYRRRADA